MEFSVKLGNFPIMIDAVADQFSSFLHQWWKFLMWRVFFRYTRAEFLMWRVFLGYTGAEFFK